MSLDRAQKNEQLILKKLAEIGQIKAADALGVDDSSIYNMKAEKVKVNFKTFSVLLATMGIKCIPEGYMCVDPRTFNVLYEGHRLWTESLKNPDQLLSEDQP